MSAIRRRRDALSAESARQPDKEDPKAQVEMALSLFDELQGVLSDPAARAALQGLLEKINLRLWLDFGEGTKGKRRVRVLRGGILTRGNAEPPIRPYGDDNDGDGPHTGQGGPGTVPMAAGVNETPPVGSLGQSEGVSFTMGNRGDRTPVELFLTGVTELDSQIRQLLLAGRDISVLAHLATNPANNP